MPHLSFTRHGEEDADVVAVDPLAGIGGVGIGGGGTGQKLSRRRSLLSSLRSKWRGRRQDLSPLPAESAANGEEEEEVVGQRKASLGRRVSNPELVPKGSKRVVPSLPRPQTFHRRESERRERLLEVPAEEWERRENEQERRRGWSVGGLGRRGLQKEEGWAEVERQGEWLGLTVPEMATLQEERPDAAKEQPGMIEEEGWGGDSAVEPALPEWDDDFPPHHGSYDYFDPDYPSADTPSETSPDPSWLQSEYDRRWILNLSMSFRDKSQREKFFVTYAETPTLWRRLTISLDYRAAPPNSLEADLVDMHYQRDKSFRVFEAIYESLADISYYPTVTNLKLQTTPEDDQLHVHVREDANEIIDYPLAALVSHIPVPRYPESSLELDSHLSGFVYRVLAPSPPPSFKREVLVKKEIPGPDTIDEFLYEANALASLSSHSSIITLRGLVTTPDGEHITGLLLSHAPGGALIDVLYNPSPASLPFARIAKWARQIVAALHGIHEAGFVQGDFTLSNIVLDDQDNAVVIDVNRRGCPVGWEPPELGVLIDNGQRIGLNIGVKTDLWQCGMVLWALARGTDEPERCRPLDPLEHGDAPAWYREVVGCCLSEKPQGRKSGGELLKMFPRDADAASVSPAAQHLRARTFDTDEPRTARFAGMRAPSPTPSAPSRRGGRRYIDPALSITLSDVYNHNPNSSPPAPDHGDGAHHHARGSSDSWLGRGRSPASSFRYPWRRSGLEGGSGSGGTSRTSVSSRPRERSRSMSGSVSPAARRGRVYRYDDECDVEVFDEPAASSDGMREPGGREGSRSPVREGGGADARHGEDLMPAHAPGREEHDCIGGAPRPRPETAADAEEVYPPPLHQDSGFGDGEASLLREMVPKTGQDTGAKADARGKFEDDQEREGLLGTLSERPEHARGDSANANGV